MATRYRRVTQVDGAGEEESTKKVRAERADRISAKIHALVWVFAALAIVYFTDLFNLVHSEKLNRIPLNLAIICFFANVGIFFYLTVWLPLVLKVTAPWDIYCPNMIPLSTGLGVAFSILVMLAFWPVWGILTPLYVAILMIGLIFCAHFIPWPC